MPSADNSGSCCAAAAPGPFGSKRADVHLIDDLSANALSLPVLVGPGKRARIHHTRRAMRSLRLRARSGVGMAALAFIDAEAIERACIRRCDPGEVSVGLGAQRMKRARRIFIRRRFQRDIHRPGFRRPNAEMRLAVTEKFGTDRVTAGNHGSGHALFFADASRGGNARRGSLQLAKDTPRVVLTSRG